MEKKKDMSRKYKMPQRDKDWYKERSTKELKEMQKSGLKSGELTREAKKLLKIRKGVLKAQKDYELDRGYKGNPKKLKKDTVKVVNRMNERARQFIEREKIGDARIKYKAKLIKEREGKSKDSKKYKAPKLKLRKVPKAKVKGKPMPEGMKYEAKEDKKDLKKRLIKIKVK